MVQRSKSKRSKHELVGIVEGDDDSRKAEESDNRAKKEKRRNSESATKLDLLEDEPLTKKKKRKRDNTSEGNVEVIDLESASTKKDRKGKKERKEKRRKSSHSQEITNSVDLPTSAAPSIATIEAFLTKHSINILTERTEVITPIISFGQLDIPSELRSALIGFKEPTPVQACTWPPGMQGWDVVGIAETGSGKTLAFGLPALSRLISSLSSSDRNLEKCSTISILVVAPTRELAIQTHETLSTLGAPFGIASVAIFGGVSKDSQINALSGVKRDGKMTRIVVGTPGRILDLVNDGVCDLSRVDFLVLDEADRMLDQGFENDIRKIISLTKQGVERQTMMFSATWPEAVRRLANTFLRDPVRVSVGSDDLTANRCIEQIVEVFDDPRSKDSRLLAQLRSLAHKKNSKVESNESRILIFALYKKEASRVEAMLRKQGYSVGALHGDMSQPARMDALEKFKNGTTGLMVATDVAARGLDIPNVSVVINYTFPLRIEDYIHRIGRTGRGGRHGKSITYFTGENHERSLAGELARVLRESGFEAEGLKKFPMTIKKKEHSVYGAFYREDIPAPKGPTKIVF